MLVVTTYVFTKHVGQSAFSSVPSIGAASNWSFSLSSSTTALSSPLPKVVGSIGTVFFLPHVWGLGLDFPGLTLRAMMRSGCENSEGRETYGGEAIRGR